MNVQGPRTYTRIAVAIVVGAVIIAATIFVTLGTSTTVTKTLTEFSTSTETLSLATGNTSTTATARTASNTNTAVATCTIAAEGFLLMRVLNSTDGEPISSLPAHVEALYPACSTNPPYKQDLGMDSTNASGFLPLSGPYEWFYVSIKFDAQSYSANASISAGIVTCVTLTIPAGGLNVTMSCSPRAYFTA